jgi:hypothetical protein
VARRLTEPCRCRATALANSSVVSVRRNAEGSRYAQAMVKKVETVVTLTDDLDGSKADRSVSFAVNGVNYEIDLSKKNANAFEKLLAPYVAGARRIPNRRRGSRAGAGSRAAGRSDVSSVRDWARENGYEVSDRGRIPAALALAYEAAH